VDASHPAPVDLLVSRPVDQLSLTSWAVRTARVPPVQATVEQNLAVGPCGTALLADRFGGAVADGGAGAVIASSVGPTVGLDPTLEDLTSTTPMLKRRILRRPSGGDHRLLRCSDR
jgi:hypothetical protein